MTKEERNLALQALEQIAKHEKECGERYGEVVSEIKELRNLTTKHAERWERLAWLVIGTVLTTGVVAWSKLLLP
jgi:hypothetical protein|tara:strand:- start:594 stop:815 length:222 start_codon:yes stop_codon:yes gene_type:complete